MDLNTITSIVRPRSLDDTPAWAQGDAWLAGGTWLYSEPQADLHRLIDLQSFEWPALTVHPDGLEIAATCTIKELDAFVAPTDWTAACLINPCCRALLASFKIWTTATIGGNLCMALPAGAMISLTAALNGECEIWSRHGTARRVPVLEFVTGPQQTILQDGELLRSIHIPIASMHRKSAFRQMSLTPVGRSAALLIGTASDRSDLELTVTASTKRPIQIRFNSLPTCEQLSETLQTHIAEVDYHDDVHGHPAWRRAITGLLAEQIRVELGPT